MQGLFSIGFDMVFVIQKLLFIVVFIKVLEIEVIFMAVNFLVSGYFISVYNVTGSGCQSIRQVNQAA